MRVRACLSRAITGGAVLLVSACRGGEPVVPPEASRTWPQMGHEERIAHMEAVVEPQMGATFQSFDASRFADFGCETCHGPGAEDGTFAMPNRELPRLDPSFFYRKHRKEAPEITHFMWKTVRPNMADLLGLPEGDKGIDCSSCHLED